MKLNPNVTFSINAKNLSHDEHLAWSALIARVHAGETNPTATVGKRLLSLIPMHATKQTPMAWSEVFAA